MWRFVQWLVGGAVFSVFALLPCVWITSWLNGIFTGNSGFSIEAWLITSVATGYIAATVVMIDDKG